MCGIIAVLRRPSTRVPPTPAEVMDPIAQAVGLVATADPAVLDDVAELLESADRLLRGVPGLRTLLEHPDLATTIDDRMAELVGSLGPVESALDAGSGDPEASNAHLTRVRDAAWAVARDRLGTCRGVGDLASVTHPPSPAGLAVLLSIQQALTAIDRLEVRGRDSAGLQVSLWGHGVDAVDRDDPLYRSGATRRLPDGGLAVVAKVAAEIGELGDNTTALRAALRHDDDLARALASPDVEGAVLGHTRWASVGIISEANAHPLESPRSDDGRAPVVTAVQNGDVDNHADLTAAEGLTVVDEITTDAKVVPGLCAAYLTRGEEPLAAFLRTVRSFEGSLAIAASVGATPDRLLLSLRGSGQALYVGLADDAFVVASEPYGVVEVADTYLRMDGETPADAVNPIVSRGQVVELDGRLAGTVDGITRWSFDERPLPVDASHLTRAEITTRDIDRGDHPHYLLKEIGESPNSVRSTLRGHLVDRPDGGIDVHLGSGTLNDELRDALAAGCIGRVVVIGQGTAAVAGEAVAAAIEAEIGHHGVRVEVSPATELSGFGLRPDMSDTCVVAISQSGTTTDTNRTVDLVRSRGARVVAIVNRRNSDLTDRADGVLYTSDGRDVEMSVASTKAFYAQATAGFLLAAAMADAMGVDGAPDRQALLSGLRSLPEVMEQVLARRTHIGVVADRHAPPRRHWAVVGSGGNLVAAREIRIKLSELCYKSIASDATEDKKHIDLSSEPLILVCATGLVGSTADDVAKEVAIYRAHKAAPIVVLDEGTGRFGDALDTVTVPAVHPRLAFLPAAMVGHLFGYEAARAIDAQADPLRVAHAAIEHAAVALSETGSDAGPADDTIAEVRSELAPVASRFADELRSGRLNGHLEASTAVRLASLFRYAVGDVPLDSYQREFGRVGTPALVLDDLAAALTVAIEELTRPIDAIKHQAKTVTVGISRTDETLLEARLARAVIDAGSPRDRLSYRTLRLLADLDPAVVDVVGFTRYRIDGLDSGTPTTAIVDRGGVSTGIVSRTDRDPVLRGTKHRVAIERKVLVTRGVRDGRTLVLVPEVKDAEAVGLTLLHVVVADRLGADVLRGVLQGYHDRYDEIRDAVCETEPTLRDDLLSGLPVEDLLVEPVGAIADRLRS